MFQKVTISNGMRIIFVPEKFTQVVTVLIMVGTGSKYEKRNEMGISHFLEHMYFKGTKKRPSPKDVVEVLDEIGGIYNAFTSQEYTGYFAKVPKEKIEVALDWVSDILLNSLFEDQEIEKERGVIREEINMVSDNPMSYIQLLWGKALYGDQPAGWPITGNRETIQKIKRENLINYMKEQYVGSNIVIGVAGNFIQKEALGAIKRYFKEIKKGKSRRLIPVKEFQERPRFIFEKRKTDQFHLVIGVRGVSLFNKNRYLQDILSIILGGMMSSRLFQTIREEMGISYYIHTESHSDLETGFLATYAGLKIEKIYEGISEILKEYRMVSQNLSLEELKKAKENFKGRLSILLESSDHKAFFFTSQELLEKRIYPIKEIFRKINEIRLSQIRSFAKKIFNRRSLNLALIGPSIDKNQLKRIFTI